MLFGQIHGYLTGLHHLALAALGVDDRLVELEVFAYFADDGVDGDRLVLNDAHGLADDALSQVDVDFALEEDGLCQQGVDDAFQFAHAFVHVFCNVFDDVFGDVQSVALNFVAQDVLAQFHVRFFQFGYQSPLEAGEQSVFHAL